MRTLLLANRRLYSASFMHDLGLDVGARCLGVELEDLVQGSKLARVDVLTQALKLSAQVIGRLRVVASEEFVDQAGDAQA